MGATYENPRNSSCAVALGGTPGESTNIQDLLEMVALLMDQECI